MDRDMRQNLLVTENEDQTYFEMLGQGTIITLIFTPLCRII